MKLNWVFSVIHMKYENLLFSLLFYQQQVVNKEESCQINFVADFAVNSTVVSMQANHFV